MRKVILIGEVHGPGPRPVGLPLTPRGDGTSADRLMALAGFTLEEYERAFPVRMNLFTYREQLRPHGGWPRRNRCIEAGREIMRMHLDTIQEQRWAVLLLGRARDGFREGSFLEAMKWSNLDLCSSTIHGGVAWMPHPSGRCRVWNDEGNRQEARAFLRAIIE